MSNEKQADNSHLGKLLSTSETIKFLNTNEATFNNWKGHKLFVVHEGGSNGITNLHYENCIKVRNSVFDNLKRRKHPPKFTQKMIGEIFESTFGEDDSLLINKLRDETPENIIKIVIEQCTKK